MDSYNSASAFGNSTEESHDFGSSQEVTFRKYTYSLYSESCCINKNGPCDVVIHNGKVRVFNYEGTVRISTLLKTFDVRVDELKASNFYGPIVVRYGACNCHLMAKKICTIDTDSASLADHDCSVHNDFWFIVMISIQSILLLLSYFFMRYFWIRLKWAPKNYKLVASQGKLVHFYQKFKQINPDVAIANKLDNVIPLNFDKEHQPKMNADAKSQSIYPSLYNSIEFKPRTIVLAILFFLYPSPSSSRISDFTTFRIGINDSLIMGDFHLSVLDASWAYPLTLDYYTADWSVSQETDWHCTDSACNSHGMCTSTPTTGRFTTAEFFMPEEWDSGKRWRLRRFCEWTSSGCAFRVGCWKWLLKYKINPNEISPVFHIGQAIRRISTVSNSSNHLDIVSMNLIESFNPAGLSLVHYLNESFYLCPSPSNRLEPRSGMIGDLQLNRTFYSTIAMDTAFCKSSLTEHPRCSISKSFHHSIPSECSILPTHYGSYMLFVKEGVLVAYKANNLEVVIRDELHQVRKSIIGDCKIVKKVLWGVKDSGLPYRLIITPELKANLTEKQVVLPCNLGHAIIICNGEPVHFEIPSPSECTVAEDDLIINEIDGKFSDYHTYSNAEDTEITDSSTFLDVLSNVTFLKTLLPMTGSSVGFLLVIVVIVLRR